MVEVHVGDCRAVMPALPASSVDCCITDPPYGDTSLDWDRICVGWVSHVSRVLKPAASIWVFGSMRFLAPLFDEMQAEGFRYSQDIVWEKQNGTGFHNDRFRRVHEHAVMFYRGQWREVFHETQFTMDARAKVVLAKRSPAHTGHIEKTPYVSVDGGPRMMRSVLAVRNEHGRAVHPTQKPVELLAHLIRYSCPPGGVVLDPFAGSGSTGLAARQNGRRAILIEEHPERAETMRQRLAQDAPLLQGTAA
ncbi:DNA-methyltransferase [Lysobacter enzymogenes]|uniref:DNA-methyltransferase n=1 Tax=Lysobacter enzymogenes TaxID=69 RepID=UPI000C7B0B3B|nr:site-specific DNA-methyltransferase [Lysobacter enzymogenes]UZW62714.1 site-specific DNA-methyltransferase [Lysobacter enzymogenes]